jgi:hypothetical protein
LAIPEPLEKRGSVGPPEAVTGPFRVQGSHRFAGNLLEAEGGGRRIRGSDVLRAGAEDSRQRPYSVGRGAASFLPEVIYPTTYLSDVEECSSLSYPLHPFSELGLLRPGFRPDLARGSGSFSSCPARRKQMDDRHLMTMNIAANILTSYYSNKVCYCIVNKKEPSVAEKDDLLKRAISMFENLSTSYLKDIETIAEAVK